MRVLTCCQSNKVEKVEYKTVYVYPQLYFPKKINKSPLEIPLDENFKQVKSDYDEAGNPIVVEWVLTPFWLYKLRTDYQIEIDKAEAEYKSFIRNLPP